MTVVSRRLQYFQDGSGLIYYGQVEKLNLYNNMGVGLCFVDPVWVDKKKYRIWVYLPQERIDESRRKKAFLTEIAELEKAIAAGEEVNAFFVGAFPVKTPVQGRDGGSFDLYRAELASVDHLSLVFAK